MTPHGTANRYINHGCKCAPCTAANARRVKAYKLRRLEGVHSPTDRVPSIGARRRLQALATLGWSIPALAAVADAPVNTLHEVATRTRITRATHAAVVRAYDALWDRPAPETCKSERVSARRVRALAVRRGWVPPLAWDDDSIDDPAAAPSGVRRRGERWSVEDVEELLRAGDSHEAVCRRLGTSWTNIERRLHRAGRTDLLPLAWAGRRVA